jgi:hypothetical protein
VRLVYHVTGGFGKVDRGSWFSSGETRSDQYAAAHTSWGDTFIHYYAGLPIHIRDQTNGHHTEGMDCWKLRPVQLKMRVNIEYMLLEILKCTEHIRCFRRS